MAGYYSQPSRVPPSRCPYCGKLLDMATSSRLDGSPPLPGDHNLCFGCGGVLIFEAGMTLRKLTAEELAAMPLEARKYLEHMQRRIRRLRTVQKSQRN